MSGSTCAKFPTAPDSLPTATTSRARRNRSRLRPASTYHTATFRPNVVGSAWTPCVRPTINVSLWRRSAKLHGQRAVPHVVGRQPDVDEARVGAELLLQAGEQRDHLVLHAVLDLEDAADVDARLLPDASQGVGRDAPTARVGLAHRELDTQPGRVLRLLAPDPPHAWTRVPLDHVLTLVQNLEGWKCEPAAATRL